MSGELWAGIAGAVLTFMAALLALPKVRADARRSNAEADDRIVARLYREIERLDRSFDELAKEFAEFKKDAIEEKHELENENKLLRTQVGRLRKRVEGLEKILKVEVKITPEMQRLLDELPDDTDERDEP